MRTTPRKFLFLLIIFSLVFSACSLADSVSLPSNAPALREEMATPTLVVEQILPPDVVETLPLSGSKIALQEPISFYFNQPMDRASVENAWVIDPVVEGDFAWVDDATLTFTPRESLEAGASLNVAIEMGAKSAKGVGLTESVQYSFNAADHLRPIQFLPEEGSADLDVDSAVVVTFGQPVVPLGADPETLPAAFSLEPAAPGRGEWLNTSTYIFYPEPALAGGVTYRASLNLGLLSVAGTSLENGASWSFTTALPRILDISPSTEIPLPLDLEWTFTFNQPMDAASVESNFSFVDENEAEVGGRFEWAEDVRSMTYIVNENLTRDSNYRLFLSGNAKALGGTPLARDRKVEVYSSPNFGVISTDPVRGGLLNEYQAGHIYFSTFVDPEDVEDHLVISPAADNFSVHVYENAIHLNGSLDFETSYALTILPTLKDVWGQELGEEFVYRFTTPAPQAKLTFPYLSSPFYFTSADDPTFYIQSTNINGVDLTLGEVPLVDFFRLFGENSYEERQNYVPENAVSWQQLLDIERNKSKVFALDLATEADSIKPGIYSLRVQEAYADGGDPPDYIIASNANVVFKFGTRDALVWATELKTGARLIGQTVSIYDFTGTLLAQGVTDETGMWRGAIELPKGYYQNLYALLGQPGDESFGFSSSAWGDDFSPWQFGLESDTRPPHTETYLYTDRPIYRPGQTVYFRAILRNAFDGRYSLSEYASIPITVSDGYGENVHTLNPTISEYGTAHGSYTIPEDARSGYYTFYSSELEFSTYFQVADYRKPEINLTLNTTPDELQKGENLKAEIDTQYYFDAPASNLPIQWALYEDKGYFHLPGYSVGKIDLSWMDYASFGGYYGDILDQGEGSTNAEGFFSLNLDTLDAPEGTRELTFEVSAIDDNNQWISERATTTLHPDEFYIGLKSDSWVGREETEMGFDVLTVDWNTDPRVTQNLRATFKRVTWERQDSDSPYESATYVPTYTPASEVDFATGDDGVARLAFTPPDPGTYILEVSGGKASTEIMLWVRGAEKAIFPNLPNQHIKLTADQDSYKSGETAEIFIPNPLEFATQALITVERGTIRKSEIINLEASGTIYSLPLTEEDAPTVYFAAVLLNGREYRVGYTEIKVAADAQILNIQITSEPTRSEPGGEVSFGIQVTDSAGSPVQGEFSLALVDLAVLALADPNSEPIEKAFYDKVGLGIQTSLSMAGDSVYGVFLDFGGMGGGGGGEEVSVIRDDFRDTAYWNAEIVTDENGQAQVSVVLPDNLTTWQVDLRGVTSDTRVGSAEMQIVSTKDLLLRPVTPRFLVVGDHVEMAAILHNNTAEELSGNVSLQAIGFLLDDPNAIEQQITIPAGERVKVSWWGTAQDAEVAELLFSSAFGPYTDITRPTWGALPILRYTSPQSFVTAGTLETAGTLTESISLPRSFVPNGGKLEVTLDPSLAAVVLEGLEAVPEPKSSSSNEAMLCYFFPNIAIFKALQAAGMTDPALQERLETLLEKGVRRLLPSQNEDYGWGWYASSQSDPYLSAYILFGLWQARDVAYVDETVFANGREYLHTASLPYLEGADLQQWQKDRLAFMQYVMQITGGADAIAVDQLVIWRDEISPWAQALLALTLDSRTPGDARASSLLANLEASALRSASGAHWESDSSSWRNPGTPNYTTATVIYALAQKDATNPLLNDAVRYLSAHRNIHGCWSSTYENAWSLMAFTEVLKGASELNANFSFSADLNKDLLVDGQANALVPITATTLLDGLQLTLPNALNITRGEGEGRLYYRAALFADRAAETAPALNQGMEIQRAYYVFSCEDDCAPLDAIQLAAVDKVKVELTLSIPEDSYYVMVEDHIPAGAEILNQQLKTPQLGEEADDVILYDPDNPFAKGWGWWLFSEPQIGDENIQWSSDYLPAGTYILSYTLIPLQAGEYRVLPAQAWQSYFPEVQGTSPGRIFRIEE